MNQSNAAAHIREIERDGWIRRFTAIGPRLQEAVDLYRGLGFDIKLEPADARPEDIADESVCARCFVMTLAQTIYTRPLAHGGEPGQQERHERHEQREHSRKEAP